MGAIPVPPYSDFVASSKLASRIKRQNRADGGKAERMLRRMLWREGTRFRKHVRSLPGTPDLVFNTSRVCVFCDGDFWHGRHWAKLRRRLSQRANAQYWMAKIARNRQRDREHDRLLVADGWLVVRVWETDVLADPRTVSTGIRRAVQRRTRVRSG